MIKLNSKLLTFDLEEKYQEALPQLTKSLQSLNERSNDQQDWVGWLNLADDVQSFQEVQDYADKIIASEKFDNLLVLGIGGSALGAQCLMQALRHPLWNELSGEQRQGALKLYFIDNVDPDWNHSLLSQLDMSRTLFCVITKSGGTAETTSAFLWVYDRLRKDFPDTWKEHLICVTDPKKGVLRDFVEREDLQSFSVPPHVGGRFSAFTAVGMLPLALAGIKIEKFRQGLLRENSSQLAAKLAVALHHADNALQKSINVLMPYSSHLSRLSDWYVQLLAESIGKTPETGPTPLKAVGATDQHSQVQLFMEGPKDKLVFFIKLEKFKHELNLSTEEVIGFENLAGESHERLIHAEGKATSHALYKQQVPSLDIILDEINEENIAQLLYILQIMTALAGDLYGVNPFNQPGVELGKKYTYALLGKKGYEEYADELA